MARKSNSNVWLWLLGGGAAAWYLFSRVRDDGVTLLGVTPVTPGAHPSDGGARLNGVDVVQSVPISAPTPRPAPTSVFARPCQFITTQLHPVYAFLDGGVSAFLLADTQVTVVAKRVVDGVTWFGAQLSGAETVPRLDPSAVRNPVWFAPNADERSRCT